MKIYNEDPKPTSSEIVPSKYQQDIYAYLEAGCPENLEIQGVAGCGKSTTLEELARRIPEGESGLAVAFNKAIAEELQTRMPKNVSAMTFHSMGYGLCRSLGWFGVNKNKLPHLLSTEVMPITTPEYEEIYWSFGKGMCRLVSLLKSNLLTPETPYAIETICEHHEIDMPETLYKIVARLYHKSLEFPSYNGIKDKNQKKAISKKRILDFDDMIFFPIQKDMRFRKYRWILVDEAQDLNPLQREFIKHLMYTGQMIRGEHIHSKVIVVGDPDQAIYAFRGASPSSMIELKEAFNTTSFPLSISYRCADSIVAEAQTIVPRIEGSGKQGTVRQIHKAQLFPELNNGDFVLCRCTAPLIEYCLTLISKGKKGNVLGLDLLEGLQQLIKTLKRQYPDFKVEDLEYYKAKEGVKLERQGKKYEKFRVEARVDTLQHIFLHPDIHTLDHAMEAIQNIFADKIEEGVTFSTIHKAKGLEADRVFLIRPDMIPHKRATKPWQLKQERNLKYVAITRAKKEFVYVMEIFG